MRALVRDGGLSARVRTWGAGLLLALMAAPSPAGTLEGAVVQVTDGDTVTVRIGGREHPVRLAGIDAPEKAQPFGQSARRALSGLLMGKPVHVHIHGRDGRGALRGTVWVISPDSPCQTPDCPKTLDAGMYLLTVGLAWWSRGDTDALGAERQGQYEFAEYEAKAKRAGLWQEPAPVAPWIWRDRRRARPPPSR